MMGIRIIIFVLKQNSTKVLSLREDIRRHDDFSPTELQVLMGSLLYLKKGIVNSPYSHLLDPIHWADICDVFTRDACALLGLSVESPLSVV